jgi:hypothetical protein
MGYRMVKEMSSEPGSLVSNSGSATTQKSNIGHKDLLCKTSVTA